MYNGFMTFASPGHMETKTFLQENHFARIVVCLEANSPFVCLGGCRIWDYEDFEDQKEDAQRLAYSMKLKSAWAGLKLGGGYMTVYIKEKTSREKILEYIAVVLNSFEGQYIAAKDVGTSHSDMETIALSSSWVVGLKAKSGNPVPWAIKGVVHATEALLHFMDAKWQEQNIAIYGFGRLGQGLAEEFLNRGSFVEVADIDTSKIKNKPGLSISTPEQMLKNREYTLFVPCALGGLLNAEYAQNPNAKMICGAANSQLQDHHVDQLLFANGVLYVPDSIANAGGIINAASELWKVSEQERVEEVDRRVRQIQPRTLKLLKQSQKLQKSPLQVALNWL